MFNIHIHDGSRPIPNDDILYIIAKGGIFLRKKLGLFESLSQVNNISILKDIENFAKMDIAPLTMFETGKIVQFFRHICTDYGEANIVLHYNSEDELYKFQVTEQEVTSGSVEYVNEPFIEKDYQRIGTIHSHAGMSAFHSSTDHKDEETFDGLHITFGNMKSENITISASIMANGQRFYVDPYNYLDGIKEANENIRERFSFRNTIQGRSMYSIIATEEQSKFPEEWLTKIKKKVYKSSLNISMNNQLFIDMFNNSDESKWGVIDNINENEIKDWNPCASCPYKHYKSEMLLKEVLEDLDDNEINNSEKGEDEI